MKKIWGVLILVLFAVVAFSARVIADDEVCCPGMKTGMQGKMMGAMHERMEKKTDLDEMFYHKVHLIAKNAVELGLSDEQIQKIKTLNLNTKKSIIKSDADVELLVLDIEAGLGKDEIDVNSLNALIDKKYNLKSQEVKTLVGAYADLKKVLSKEQMKKLHEIRDKEKVEEGKCMMESKTKTIEGKEGREHAMGMR